MRHGQGERELDAATLAALSPAQLAAIEQLARQGEGNAFRFLRDVLRVSNDPGERRASGRLVDRLVDGLNGAETLAMVSQLAGRPVSEFRGDATRFLPGHFLTTHNDRGPDGDDRVLAVVVNLCHWQIDWGGLTLFHDALGDAECAWTPRFNTLNLFRVPQYHSVSWVNALAQEPRLAVSGWFYS
jgi:Rps23 Pro-64 3,4-dihydroxylase Tpa1-like proline 4-hydroxylase